MSDTHEPTPAQDRAARYEICIRGHLDARWAEWFDGLSLAHRHDGTTVLAGPLVDQAALYGVLRKVRDLGLHLVSVRQSDTTSADGSESTRSNQETNP